MGRVKEVWRQIEDNEKIFVSNLGRIKSFRSGKEKILGPTPNRQGYLHFCAKKKGKTTAVYVHRCVGFAFLGGPTKEKPFINHKNGIKTDNRLANLEYCSASENMKHAFELGLKKPRRGEQNNKAKLTDKQVLEIFYSKENSSVLREKYGVSITVLCKIWRKELWAHVLEGLENERESTHGIFCKKGEEAPNAKLTKKQVLKIHKDKRSGPIIAEEYGTTIQNVHMIKKKKTWKHLWKD